MSSPQRITRLYAWIAEEPDGGEGVVGGDLPGMGWTPLIGADRARIESYRRVAEQFASVSGYPIRLKVFGEGTVIDEIYQKADTC